MRNALLLAAAFIAVTAAPARAQGPAAPYQRVRSGADDWQTRGGGSQNWRGRFHGGYGGIYNPYYVAPPVVVGSYYQRPYSYHFDYFRDRWGAPPNIAGSDAALPESGCPCAVPPPVEVVQ